MAKLYVANCTRQNFQCAYRLEYMPNGDLKPTQNVMPTFQLIPAGRQVPLGGDVSLEQIESLIRQLEPFGSKAEVETKRLKDGRVPLVWNHQPVTPETIRFVDAHNHSLLTVEGRERRLQAAIVADEALNNQMGSVTPLFEVEVETEEVSVGDETLKTLEEGIRISRPERGGAPPTETRGRGGRRKAA